MENLINEMAENVKGLKSNVENEIASLKKQYDEREAEFLKQREAINKEAQREINAKVGEHDTAIQAKLRELSELQAKLEAAIDERDRYSASAASLQATIKRIQDKLNACEDRDKLAKIKKPVEPVEDVIISTTRTGTRFDTFLNLRNGTIPIIDAINSYALQCSGSQFNPSANTTYTVTTTNANGCTASSTATITPTTWTARPTMVNRRPTRTTTPACVRRSPISA